MTDPVHLDRILKGLDDWLLANHILEGLGPKLPGNNLIFHEKCELLGRSFKTGQGGYCVTLVYPIPLLPSGPGGVFGLQLHSPPKPVRLSGLPLKAERVGFEPTVELPPHTLSKRAP